MHDLNDLKIMNPNENHLAHKEAFGPSRIRDVIIFDALHAFTFIRIEYGYFRVTIFLKSFRKRNLCMRLHCKLTWVCFTQSINKTIIKTSNDGATNRNHKVFVQTLNEGVHAAKPCCLCEKKTERSLNQELFNLIAVITIIIFIVTVSAIL